MPVVNPIIFKVTDAGRDAAAYAFNNLPGGKLSLSAIKVGLAKYSTVGNETALQNPLPNTFSIGGGGVQAGSGQIRFTPILASLTRIEAFEIGLFTETGILFAIAATPTNIPLLVIEPDIEAIFSMNVALANVDPDSIEIVIDVNAPLAVVMMGQHISAAHPHSQYKRTLDNTERLKVADGIDNDEAVSKGQLDTVADNAYQDVLDLATAAQNALDVVDVDLSLRILQEALDRQSSINGLLLGVEQGADYFKLPDFIGGWKIKWGETYMADISPFLNHTTTITGFSTISTVLVGGIDIHPTGVGFTVHRKSFDNSSVTVKFDEWGSGNQDCAYWWLAIGK